jgi:hypothetical protein
MQPSSVVDILVSLSHFFPFNHPLQQFLRLASSPIVAVHQSRVCHCRLVQSIDVVVCDEKKEEDDGVVKWRVVLFVLLWKQLTSICNVNLSIVGETVVIESVPRKWNKAGVLLCSSRSFAPLAPMLLCSIHSVGFRDSHVRYSVSNTKND